MTTQLHVYGRCQINPCTLCQIHMGLHHRLGHHSQSRSQQHSQPAVLPPDHSHIGARNTKATRDDDDRKAVARLVAIITIIIHIRVRNVIVRGRKRHMQPATGCQTQHRTRPASYVSPHMRQRMHSAEPTSACGVVIAAAPPQCVVNEKAPCQRPCSHGMTRRTQAQDPATTCKGHAAATQQPAKRQLQQHACAHAEHSTTC